MSMQHTAADKTEEDVRVLCCFACIQCRLLQLQLLYPAVQKVCVGTGMPSKTQPVPILASYIPCLS